MKTFLREEKYNLLSYKGVDPEVQLLFSQHFAYKKGGSIIFDYKNESFDSVDSEIYGLNKIKHSNSGIWVCHNTVSQLISNVYVSSSVLNLIAFSQLFKGRYNFERAAFISIGENPNKNLTLNRLKLFPNAKISTLFGNNILGRIMDCKIAHWLRNEEATFELKGDIIFVKYNKNIQTSLEREQFSLSNYFKLIGKKPPINTLKPRMHSKNKNYSSDNFMNILFFN